MSRAFVRCLPENQREEGHWGDRSSDGMRSDLRRTGSVPAFVWRESGKPFWKKNLSNPDRDSNLCLPVICILVYRESGASDHTATEVDYLCGVALTRALNICIVNHVTKCRSIRIVAKDTYAVFLSPARGVGHHGYKGYQPCAVLVVSVVVFDCNCFSIIVIVSSARVLTYKVVAVQIDRCSLHYEQYEKNSKAIRKEFLDFFIDGHDHTFIQSSPVVPFCDPSVAFVNAGMNQFKGVLLNQHLPPCDRAVNSQKCIMLSSHIF
uniref:Alanyl-tRNA synthetase class IIc N-terminal domain-containing protein n=1 Tax=Timema genevievae TaxID=629358 RepID=A0A7R9JQ50_TIMGE|nr:unnamed protein product [Timema genevievae]